MVSDPRDRNLTDDKRLALYAHLLSKSVDPKLSYGSMKAAAEEFKVHPRTVTRIWKRRLDSDDDVGAISDIRNSKKGHVGRPSIDAKTVNDALVSVPARHRQTLHHASTATGFSISTLLRVRKRGEIRRVSNKMEPILTKENKPDRVRWGLLMISPQTLLFTSMHDYVLLDEKWL